jgi:hypothetical protein
VLNPPNTRFEKNTGRIARRRSGEPQISKILGDCQCMGITLRFGVYCRFNSAKRLFTIFKRWK